MSEQTVCVIGGGISGLASIKKLRDAGHAVVCFEIGSDVGGLWRYDSDNGRSPAYASLRIDTSKRRFEFADFAAPKQWGPYLHHTQVLEYLESYVDAFDLRDSVRFRHRVVNVERVGERWSVEVEDLETSSTSIQSFDAVVVASGHHWDPNTPAYQGEFDGETLHAQEYRIPEPFIGKDVVVVGLGNTGADIACELSWHAKSVTLSTRSGAHVLPRFLLGRPIDTFSSRASSRLPLSAQRFVYRALLAASRGTQSSYGVPTPATPVLSQHPTVSQDLLRLVKEGHISVNGDISRMAGGEVVFVNGDTTPADVIIYATGYKITFPFLDDQVVEVRENRIDLFNMVVPVDVRGLFFVGLIQPVGALPPLAEQQARWVAQLVGGAALPSPGEMRAEIVVDTFTRQAQYAEARRHTIQVDYWPYLDRIRKLCDVNDAGDTGTRDSAD